MAIREQGFRLNNFPAYFLKNFLITSELIDVIIIARHCVMASVKGWSTRKAIMDAYNQEVQDIEVLESV